jgi:hypothetical protein
MNMLYVCAVRWQQGIPRRILAPHSHPHNNKKFPAGIPMNACEGHFFHIPVPRGDRTPSGILVSA